MARTCSACGHVNDDHVDSPMATCPACNRIYERADQAAMLVAAHKAKKAATTHEPITPQPDPVPAPPAQPRSAPLFEIGLRLLSSAVFILGIGGALLYWINASDSLDNELLGHQVDIKQTAQTLITINAVSTGIASAISGFLIHKFARTLELLRVIAKHVGAEPAKRL